jgi:hypothetical protein
MPKTNSEKVRASEVKKRASGLREIRVWVRSQEIAEELRELARKRNEETKAK